MKNNIFFLIKSKLTLNIKGNNIERFLKRLKNNDIEILKIKYISKNEINIKIYKYDYEKIIKLKTIYNVDIYDYHGLINFYNKILQNRLLIIYILIAFIFMYIITNIIFEIDVVTNDSKMETILLEELNKKDIKKYKFKKNYIELQEIKKYILSKYKNKLEWIEIESIGTKYIVRYEPRIQNEIKEDTPLRNIIAKKDCVVRGMNISSGQIVKDVGSYVKKGDIIVSGYITSNDTIKNTISSEGVIYGETWYKVTIDYPYKYKEEYETGNKNNVFVIKFLNKNIELFNFNKYKTKKIKEKTIIKNNILPIKLVKQVQKETKLINENNTEEDIVEKSIKIAENKIKLGLKDNEYIKDYKILSKIKYTNSITFNIFFSVVEDVTAYEKIYEYKENLKEKQEN